MAIGAREVPRRLLKRESERLRFCRCAENGRKSTDHEPAATHVRSPARNGPDRLVRRCPLIGVDRKCLVDGQNDAIDPQRTSHARGNLTLMFSEYLERWKLTPDGEAIATPTSRLLPVRWRGSCYAQNSRLSGGEARRPIDGLVGSERGRRGCWRMREMRSSWNAPNSGPSLAYNARNGRG